MLFCALLTAVSVGVPASHRVQLDVPAIKEGAVDIDCESEPGRSCQFRSGPSSMDPAVVDTWYDSLLEYTKRKRSELVSGHPMLNRTRSPVELRGVAT